MRVLTADEITQTSGGWGLQLWAAANIGWAAGQVVNAASPGTLDVAADWQWNALTA